MALIGGALFFFTRELGTFPAAWADDSLFMIVARSIADGKGYTLPILDRPWSYPYILGVGPTLLLPVALAIKLFGFSVAIARLPMLDFLCATAFCMYIFTNHIAGRNAARWTSALLISLSAFVNTGKPVLGEVPGFFFLLLGLLTLQWKPRGSLWGSLAGICFGLAVLTKITYGLVFPAIGVAWVASALRRDWKSSFHLTIVGMFAVTIYLPWRLLELLSQPGLLRDFLFLWGGNENHTAVPFSFLLSHPTTLFRLPFLVFGLFFLLGSIGFWRLRPRLSFSLQIFLPTLAALFVLYFGSSFLWYRHLLPAHLLLLPFVTMGMQVILKRPFTEIALITIVALQGIWQLDHRGASYNAEAMNVATTIVQDFSEKPLIIQQAEIFARLPENTQWFFLTNPLITQRLPAPLGILSPAQRCLPILRKLNGKDLREFGERAQKIEGRYFVVSPPSSCPLPPA